MNRSEQINELVIALSKAQASIPNATMNKINPHFKSKYADLASVLDAIRAPLAANGLAIMQTTEIRDGSLALVTTLAHGSGQWVSSEYPLPAVARPQELGSALTYARRYSVAAIICNAADEDDDAENAEKGKQKIEVKTNIMKEPIDAETGEIFQVPGPIAIPQNNEGVNDWIAFGQMIIALSKANPSDTDEWLSSNSDSCAAMAELAPKIHKRMMGALSR